MEHVAELGRVEHATEPALEQTAELGRIEKSGPKLCLRFPVPEVFVVGAALLGRVDASGASTLSSLAAPGCAEVEEDAGQAVAAPPQL